MNQKIERYRRLVDGQTAEHHTWIEGPRGTIRSALLELRHDMRECGGDVRWEETKIGWFRSYFDVVVSGPVSKVSVAARTIIRWVKDL